jgi:transposase, IS30 family
VLQKPRLARSFPHRPKIHVSHETIDQSLFVQGRAHLRAGLHTRPYRPRNPSAPGRAQTGIVVEDPRHDPDQRTPRRSRRPSCTRTRGGRPELTRQKDITLATDLAIYFCDLHKPCHCGSNENTNGLLRQYFPEPTDLSVHSPERLLDIAAEPVPAIVKALSWLRDKNR